MSETDWFFSGFPWLFPGFSHVFQDLFPNFSQAFPDLLPYFSQVFLDFFPDFSQDFPDTFPDFPRFSLTFSWCPAGYQVTQSGPQNPNFVFSSPLTYLFSVITPTWRIFSSNQFTAFSIIALKQWNNDSVQGRHKFRKMTFSLTFPGFPWLFPWLFSGVPWLFPWLFQVFYDFSPDFSRFS